MTSRDRVIRALLHAPVDRAPRDLWATPEVEASRGDEVAEMQFRCPSDFLRLEPKPAKGHRAKTATSDAGEYTDAWGCVWRVTRRGGAAELIQSPLADDAAIAGYRPPFDLLESGNRAAVNQDCRASSRFVLAWTERGPFGRLQVLRGEEAALSDLGQRAGPLMTLLGAIHEFSVREMEMWAESDVDGVVLRDDWGSEQDLLLSTSLWRELFKPLYRSYCEILHAKDKFVFFHCHGYVEAIIEDLVEIGIDAVRVRLSLLDVEALAKQYRGRIAFWAEADRDLLARAAPKEIRCAVHRIRSLLDSGHGGLIAQCDWEPNACFENVAAVLEAWLPSMPGAVASR